MHSSTINNNTIALETPDFNEIIEKDLHVVDKTLFIKEFMEDWSKVCTILRPQGFGKSTNLSMLESFLSIGADPSKFARFEIGKPQYKPFVDKHCGKYPVVRLCFKDCKGETWEELSAQIVDSIKRLLRNHSADLSKKDPFNLNKLPTKSVNIKDFSGVLDDLVITLSNLYNSRVIVLIDDFDTPLLQAHSKGYYEKASRFLVHFFSRGLKESNGNLQKACFMGIVNFIATKKSKICSVTDDNYSSSFGFRKDEISRFMKVQGTRSNPAESDDVCERDLENMLELYNGYTIGNLQSIINPWSFVCWLRQLKKTESHWVNTSSETIRSVLKRCIPSVLEIISTLLLGDEPVYISDFSPIDESSLGFSNRMLSFFVHTGYLSCKPTRDNGLIELFIPNKDLRVYWQGEYLKCFTRIANCIEMKQDIYQYLTANPFDIASFEGFLETYFVPSFSHLKLKFKSAFRLALVSFLRVIFLEEDDVIFYARKDGSYSTILFEIRPIKRVICIKLNMSSTTPELARNANLALRGINEHEFSADFGIYKGVEFSADFGLYEGVKIGISFTKKRMSSLVCETTSSRKHFKQR